MYPLHLDLSPEQALFHETSRKLLEAESPLPVVRRRAEEGAGVDRGLWQRQAELGWFGLLVPEALGGGSLSGTGLVDLTIVAAELGRLVQPGPVLPTALAAGALAAGGAASHLDVLAGLVGGDVAAAWCPPDETGAGVRAVSRGADYVLEGTARYIQDAGEADVLLVTADAPGGLRQFLVERSVPGLDVEPLETLDLARQLCDVHFDAVVVPAASMMGTQDAVARQLVTAVALQNVETVGAAEAVFELTLQYAKDRMAFGRPIGSYQAIKHRLADMLTTLESCKATAMAAAWAVESSGEEAAELVSVAKAFVGRVAPTVVQDCVQIHGGIGVTWDHDIHLYLRRVVTNAALYGTPRDHERRLAALLSDRSPDG